MGLYLSFWAESFGHLMGQLLASAQFSGPFVGRASGAGPVMPRRRAAGRRCQPGWVRRPPCRRISGHAVGEVAAAARSVSKPYETRGRGSGERPRVHFPPLRDVTRHARATRPVRSGFPAFPRRRRTGGTPVAWAEERNETGEGRAAARGPGTPGRRRQGAALRRWPYVSASSRPRPSVRRQGPCQNETCGLQFYFST